MDQNETSRLLDAVPGIGPALATALVASVADPKAFRSGRNFSAWIGLVPKQHSSGGKDRLGNITKQGDRYLRSLFTAGALAVTVMPRSMAPSIGQTRSRPHMAQSRHAFWESFEGCCFDGERRPFHDKKGAILG